MTTTEPVSDWAEDFDIFDAHFVRDPYPIWQELRGECPVAHTDRWGGSHMPSTYATVTQVAHDVENFSSIEVGSLRSPRATTPTATGSARSSRRTRPTTRPNGD